MDEYCLVADVWEGQRGVIEREWKDGGFAGMLIRINDMNGGHHPDANFYPQWSEALAVGMLVAPYFVYNPWVNGFANYQWLSKELKSHNINPTLIGIDIEVRYPGYSAIEYMSQVEFFLNLASTLAKRIVIYTGGGYLDLLSSWPKTNDYWYAEYFEKPFYPKKTETWTWSKLHEEVKKFEWPKQPARVGPVKLRQISGDRLILPGNNRVVDINVWPGDIDSLKTWWGITPTVIEPPKNKIPFGKVKVIAKNLNVRSGPSVAFPTVNSLTGGTSVDVYDVSGKDAWFLVKLQNGSFGWVNGNYGTTINSKIEEET